MALTPIQQAELIAVAAFGATLEGTEHKTYFENAAAEGGKYTIGDPAKQVEIHTLLGLDEPLTGAAAVAAVLDYEYSQLTQGQAEPSNAGFAANVATNLGVDTASLLADLEAGTPRYEALAKFTTELSETDDFVMPTAEQDLNKAAEKAEKLTPVDPVDPGVKPDTPNKPEVDGETYVLTDGRDNVTGTADNDLFIADAGQNSLGMITNALSTGDRLDGGAGTDILDVTLVADESFNSAMAVRPVTDSIENVFINALAQDFSPFTNNSSTIVNSNTRLNADQMSDLEQIWSNGSEGSLRVENVGNPGNTDALTIGMRSTGNADRGSRNESNYEVYFKEKELEAGKNDGVEALSFNMLDQTAYDNKENPLKGFALDGLSFKLDGKDYSLKFDNAIADTPDTYAGLAAALNILLAKEAPALVAQGVKFEEGNSFTDPDGRLGTTINLTIPSTDSATPRLDFKDAETPYTSVEFGSSPSNNIYRQAQELDTTAPTGLPVTSNIILDDVGRGSAGGFLKVGSMSQISKTSTGVEDFNLKVQNSSSLSGLFTTNTNAGKDFAKKDKSIFITSDTDATGNLKIGNENSTDKVVEDNLKIIKTNGFKGDLSLGTAEVLNTAHGLLTGGVAVNNLKTLNTADMAGSTTFNGNVDEKGAYNYTTGSGADVVNIDLKGKAIDTVGTELNVNTGAGNDTVTIDMDAKPSFLTMDKLDNLSINTGGGDDIVYLNGRGTFNINTGANNDFVIVNTEAKLNNSVANPVAYEGEWTFGNESASSKLSTEFLDTILYKATLTVEFAGFEKEVEIKTTKGFIATQIDINNAIKDAIANDANLSKLLFTEDGTGAQQLFVKSSVNGDNALTVTVKQPTLVTTPAEAIDGKKLLESSAQEQLVADLLALGNKTSSSFVDAEGAYNPANIISDIATGETPLVNSNSNGGSSNATGIDNVNFSTINLGSGDNLVVLDSNEKSANIIEITETFNKISVVNFHNANDNSGKGTVGNHAIDFTKYLNNKVDPSVKNNNKQSEVPAEVNLNQGGKANSVDILKFTKSTADNAIDWNSLTATNLISVLNDDEAAPTIGGITASSLSATATPNLVGTTQKHIIMVENQDNPGEYKVFHVTSTLDEDDKVKDGAFDTTGAVELGTLDFGASITSINFNLVGSKDFEVDYEKLLHNADGSVVPTEAPSEEPTDPNFVTVKPVDSVAVATDAADAITFTNLETGQFTITGFNAAEDKLVLTGLTGADGATLAELAGDTIDSGVIGVQVNEIAGSTFVNLGNDIDSAVISIELAGVTDPALVNVDLA